MQTLAYDIQDLIYFGVVFVILFGGWIANTLKKLSERQERRKPAARPGPTAGGKLDDLAARRREQLRQMAGQRAGPQRPAQQQQAASEPTNLTMAERIARARAKAQYEQRSGQLKQQSQAPQRLGQDQAARRAAQVRQQQELAQRRRQQQAQTQRRQQASQQQGRQQSQAQAAPLRRQRSQVPQRPATPQPQSMQVAPEHGPIDAGTSVVHRHVADASTTQVVHARSSATARINWKSMNLAAWRRAIILKEVLDRPLALRARS